MRLIDANKLIAKWKPVVKRYEGDSKYWETAYILEGVIEDVENEPTVDAEPVVRCKDCKWQITAYCPMPSWERKDNHYCYKGAKMDEVEK